MVDSSGRRHAPTGQSTAAWAGSVACAGMCPRCTLGAPKPTRHGEPASPVRRFAAAVAALPVLALIYAGYGYAGDSWRIGEHSTVTAEGPPIYHFKTVIPVAGALVMLQGLAEIARCVLCLRTGAWPPRLEDVEEIDVVGEQLAHSEFVDEESRRAAMESAHAIEEAARHRATVDESERREP